MRSVIVLVILTTLTFPLFSEDWLLWGGKNRDFIVNSARLADKWPEAGPKQLWSREPGDGYSAIAEEAGVLYTTFRRGGESGNDVIVALDAKSGKTIWEQVYANAFTNAYTPDVGPGPYAMPQVVGDRVVTASGTGKIQSLDKKTGKVIWSHDLYKEFSGTQMIFGYSCQALPYKNTLIFLAGGPGNSAIAFNQSDGKVVWKNLTLRQRILLADLDSRGRPGTDRRRFRRVHRGIQSYRWTRVLALRAQRTEPRHQYLHARMGPG